jgi:anaerobic selenocysteine-containing dehydrogenase
MNDSTPKGSVSRRDLFRSASVTAAGVATLAVPSEVLAAERPDAVYPLDRPENQIYSACLQCNTGCGIKVKLQDGVIVKIDGNPYDPFNLVPSLPLATPITQTARIDAPLCPKGQSGLQSHYDPYRIRHVLKRAGRRGERKWTTIPFDQAITEIVEGGKLFAHVPDEENRVVTGLKELYVLRTPAAFKAMADDAKAVGKKKMTVEQFTQKHAAHLDAMIDPEHPDLGPKNNQFVYMWGRKKDGRGHFAKRFMKAFGSTNAVVQFFHQRYPRTVHLDFCDVRIDSQFFAVDARYRGDRVIVHLDPVDYAIRLRLVHCSSS